MTDRPGAWFAEEYAARLCDVLESLSGERPSATCEPQAPRDTSEPFGCQLAQEDGALLWWKQPFPLAGNPAVWIGAPQSNWSGLAMRVLRAAGEEDESQARETYLEIQRQSLGELGRSTGHRWGRTLTVAPPEEQSDAPPSGEAYQLVVAYPDQTLAPALVVVTGQPEEPETARHFPPTDASRTATNDRDDPAPSSKSKTFELLLGVELPVSVSFGRVQIALKDVLKLTAGSIVELNRSVDEPVEVVVNNCVIARGEVVVVEGNYGVRIHQIMSRQARLENLP